MQVTSSLSNQELVAQAEAEGAGRFKAQEAPARDAQIAQLMETSTASRMGRIAPDVLFRSGSEKRRSPKKREGFAMRIKVQPAGSIYKQPGSMWLLSSASAFRWAIEDSCYP